MTTVAVIQCGNVIYFLAGSDITVMTGCAIVYYSCVIKNSTRKAVEVCDVMADRAVLARWYVIAVFADTDFVVVT